MGMFDFLSSNTNTAVQQNPYGNVDPVAAPASQNKFEQLFSDDTFIRSLGETGAKISSGTPIGQAVGEGASGYVRNKAMQREGEKEAAKNQTFQEKMLASLQDGSLLSPTADNVGADAITYDGDGNITIKAKKSPDPVKGLTEQKGLESITNTPNNGGSNLPDFTSNQGGGAADFSGLDPADVQMVLGVKQNAGALTQKAVSKYLDNKYKDKALDAGTKANQAKLSLAEKKLSAEKQQDILDRKQKVADKKEDRKFKVGMEVLKNKLGKTEPGSIEYQKIEKDMENLDSQIAARNEKTANGGMTPAERERLDNEKKRIDMSIAAVEETKKKTAIDQQQDAIKYEEVILDNMDEDAAAPMMDYINQNQNKSYYYTQYDEPGMLYGTNRKGAKLPLITKNGVQMDMASVRASAEQYGMTVDDFLASPGIGILTKGDNNDYQPVNR